MVSEIHTFLESLWLKGRTTSSQTWPSTLPHRMPSLPQVGIWYHPLSAWSLQHALRGSEKVLTWLGGRCQRPYPCGVRPELPGQLHPNKSSSQSPPRSNLFCSLCLNRYLISPQPLNTLRFPPCSLHPNSFWYLIAVISWCISHNFPINIL